jgi:hypothetical protein
MLMRIATGCFGVLERIFFHGGDREADAELDANRPPESEFWEQSLVLRRKEDVR